MVPIPLGTAGYLGLAALDEEIHWRDHEIEQSKSATSKNLAPVRVNHRIIRDNLFLNMRNHFQSVLGQIVDKLLKSQKL